MPAVPVPVVSRISKRNDTGEPVTGVASDAAGPADLRGFNLRFLAKTIQDGVEIIIDSNAGDGVCINVEDETNDPANRGRYRFEPTAGGVDTAGLYSCELECTMPNGKKVTFPSAEALNPYWQIDPDIA